MARTALSTRSVILTERRYLEPALPLRYRCCTPGYGNGAERRRTPDLSLGNETDLSGCHDLPQLVARPVSRRRHESISNDDTFNHVGEHRFTRPSPHPHRHHCIPTRGPTPNAPVNPDQPRRTPKARPDQPSRRGGTGEQPGRVGEFDGGRELHGHHLSEGVLQSS